MQDSSDGTTLFAGSGGSLATGGGTTIWTFSPTENPYGTYDILSNGADAGGGASELEVADGGNLFAFATGSWYEWSSTTFVPVSDPNPETTAAQLLVGENAAATPIGIPTPSDGFYAADQLSATIDTLPTDGSILLTGGGTVSVGQVLTIAELDGLEFQPTPGLASQTSQLVYTVTDPDGLTATGSATLAILAGPLSPDGATLLPGTGGSLFTSAGSWSFGPLSDIGYSVLLSGQPAQAGFSAEELSVANGGEIFALSGSEWWEWNGTDFGAVNGPFVVAASFSTEENAAATSIGIVTPSDPNYPLSQLTVEVTSLPNPAIGELLMPDGVTPVTVDQTLTVGQLQGLEFQPAHDAVGATSFDFSIIEPDGLTLVVQQGELVIPTPPVAASPSLTVQENQGATAIGIAAPTDQNYGPSQLTITVVSLPNDGTVSVLDGAPITDGETLSPAELQNLTFTPTPGAAGEASVFWYSVTNPSGGYAAADVSLVVAPPVVAATVPAYSPPPATQPWHDPTVTAQSGSGVGSAPTTVQPSQAGDIVGFDLQNTGSATESQGFATFGQVFRDGDVGAGETLVARSGSTEYAVQMNVESTYADGSVEQAILTLQAPAIAAGSTLQLMLATGTPNVSPAGTAPTSAGLEALLQSNDVTVSFNNVSGGTAATAGVDAASALAAAISAGTVSEFVAGPEVDEFDFTTNVAGIPGLQVEFDIRAYADGTTTTDVIFNNSSVTTSGSDLDYNVTIAQGSQSFSATNVQQYLYSMWDYVIDSPGTISPNVQYDVPYLIATGAVPNYDTSYGVSSGAIQGNLSGLDAANTGPMGTAGVDTYMPGSGGRQDIGPQPNWVAQWLLSQNSTAQQVMLDDADAAGSIPWHYSDYSTQTGALAVPVDAESNPDFVPGENADGFTVPVNGWPTYSNTGQALANGDSWEPDTSHQPDLNYVPYLTTGSHYQLELLQAQADFDIASVFNRSADDLTGTVSLGIANPDTQDTRAMAWSLREVAEAAYIMPSSDPTDLALKQYFTQALDTALNGLVQQYIVDNVNGIYGELNGFIEGSSGPNTGSIVPEEENYMVMALADVAGFDIPQASADAVALLQYMNNYIAGLYTNGPNGLNPLDGSSYWTSIDTPEGAPDTTWAQLYQSNASTSFSGEQAGYPAFTPGEILGGPTTAYGGYPVLSQAALADEITYAQSPQVLQQSLQAYGFVVTQIAYAYALSGQSEAAAYQQFPQFSIVPRLPDGQDLENSQTLIDTSGNNVTLNADAISGLAPGQDALVAVVGSGTDTLIGNSVSGGMDLLYGGAGNTTLVAGAGDDYLFGGTGNTTFVAGTGSDYLQGGASLSSNIGAPDTTSNTYVIGQSVVSGGHRTTTIADFNPANDLLEVTGSIDGNNIVSTTDLLATAVSVSGGNTIVDLDPAAPGSDQIILLGLGGAVGTTSGLNLNNTVEVTYPGVVSSGQTLVVSSTDSFTSTVEGGGTLIVAAGGQTAAVVTVSGGGSEIVSGGSANATILLGGGSATVMAGTAFDTVVSSGGQEFVSGGTASGTVVAAGGSETVAAGGTASGTNVAGVQSVLADGAASGATVLAGGEQVVAGAAAGTTVSDGGAQLVATGGTAAGTTILSGGSQLVSGGTALGTTLATGGSETIAAAGTASGTVFAGGAVTVLTGGTLVVLAGQTATAIALDGGSAIIEAGAVASGTVLLSGSDEQVFGSATGAIVSGGGDEIVSGGSATGAVLSAGGSQTIVAGTTTATTVLGGGNQLVSAGATALGGTIAGSQTVLAGGTASGASIVNGGEDTVFGTASGTIISYGGDELVSAGGTASGASILSGGFERVFAAATAIGATIASAGFQDVYGAASGTSVQDGGTQFVEPGGTANATTVQSGGNQFVQGSAAGAMIAGSQSVLAGGTDGGATILDGGIQVVSAGGATTGATVSSGGTQTVSAGGLASDAGVAGGGAQVVFGSATGTALAAGAVQIVSSGGSDTDAMITGSQTVLAGGTAIGATILDGGDQSVFGAATGTTVADGGNQLVYGSATATSIESGGAATISGTATGTVVSGGGNEFVLGAVSGTIVQSGGDEWVVGSTTGTTIAAGGSQVVSSGGSDTGATIAGSQTVLSGGISISAAVLNGGVETVSAGGLTSAAVLSSGGTETVLSGGLASGTIVLAGGDLVLSGGTASGTAYAGGASGTISDAALSNPVISGATITLADGGTAVDPLIDSGGTLAVSSGGAVSNPVVSGGTLILDDGSVVSGGITFAPGTTATMVVSGLVSGTGALLLSGSTVISSFAPGNTIELASLPFSSFTGFSTAGNDLIVSAGGTTYELQFDRPTGGEAFVAFSDSGDLGIALAGLAIDAGLSVSAGGTARVLPTELAFSDPTLSPAQEVFTVTALPVDGVLLSGSTPIASGGSFTQADIDGGLITYSAAAVTSNSDSFGFTVSDTAGASGSGTFGLAISTASGAPPALVDDGPLSLAGGTTVALTDGLLDFSDQASGPAQVTYSVATAPSDGTLLSGTTALAAGSTFTQQDIDDNAISYSAAAVTTAASDGFTFTVTDAAGGKTAPQQFDISIVPALVLSGQTLVVSGGQSLSGITVMSGGTLDVAADGTVSGTVISGSEFVSSGGSDFAAIVDSGGAQFVLSGGVVDGAMLGSDALQFLFGTASGTAIASDASQIVETGGTEDGSIIGADGTERVFDDGTAEATQIAGGTLILTSGTEATGSVTFDGGSVGTLQIAGTTMPTATVSGFGPGDEVDLTGVAFSSAGTVTLGLGNVLQATENGNNYDLDLAPTVDYSNQLFQLSTDSHGGTLLGATDIVLWTNPQSGDTGYWTFANGNVAGFQDLADGNTSYAVIGIGDFDGLSQSEVLWENTTTGDTGYWTVTNGNVTGFHDLGDADPNYSIIGIGDFNGSGEDQVLFENLATGDTGYWTTNGAGEVTGFNDLGQAAPGYSVVGIGDFDGSGHDEVLWENTTTGDVGYWTTSGSGAPTGFHDLGQAAPGYSVVGVGDFDGSGHDEVLWENETTGDTGYWITNAAGAVTGFHDFGFADLAYTVVGVGDYDGSGHDEVLWENAGTPADPGTGDTGYWTTNAAGQVASFHDLGQASTSYHFVSP